MDDFRAGKTALWQRPKHLPIKHCYRTGYGKHNNPHKPLCHKALRSALTRPTTIPMANTGVRGHIFRYGRTVSPIKTDYVEDQKQWKNKRRFK